MKNNLLISFIVILVILGVALYFLGYWLIVVDPHTGETVDAFGRTLQEKPLWVAFFVSDEPTWRGFGWHFFDVLVGFTIIALIYLSIPFNEVVGLETGHESFTFHQIIVTIQPTFY